MIIDGKKIAHKILGSLKEEIAHAKRKPGLAFIIVGNDTASHIYVKKKKESCSYLGIYSEVLAFAEDVSEEELLQQIHELNETDHIDGILVQMPLPHHLDAKKVIMHIDPKKDVDGFHPVNMGRLLLGYEEGIISCTPLGIKRLLEESHIPIEGKHVVIVGRSNIVGKPLASLFLQKKKGCNATVTVVHSQTENITKLTKQADILIAAIGKPKFITKDMIKEGAVVIDVGISRGEQKKLTGDVDFENISPIASYITPVPGGVGPMTIAMLMVNTWKSYQKRSV